MTATDLLHHVFPWELATGVEALEQEPAELAGVAAHREREPRRLRGAPRHLSQGGHLERAA
mgnify:CR=1 FL=1